jgi:hypothetical protein
MKDMERRLGVESDDPFNPDRIKGLKVTKKSNPAFSTLNPKP